MRQLKYNAPYKINRTMIEDGKRLDIPDEAHYSRFSTITTKAGIVTASEINWPHNSGRICCTLFTTIINGYNHSAWLEEAQLSDRQLKWMATYFINKLYKKL
jgi:hypothetical protein